MQSHEITLVQEWHQALNTGNLEKLVALVSTDVQMGGPRGTVKGADEMLAWVARAHMTLTPQRYFQRKHVVGVEALGQWYDPETNLVKGQQLVVTVFTIEDQRITQIARYDNRREAFEVFGLQDEDEVHQ